MQDTDNNLKRNKQNIPDIEKKKFLRRVKELEGYKDRGR